MTKIGSVPWIFEPVPGLPMYGVMIWGVDVCRINQEESVVAFTSSYNETLSSYYNTVELQEKGTEVVTWIRKCMDKAMEIFFMRNK